MWIYSGKIPAHITSQRTEFSEFPIVYMIKLIFLPISVGRIEILKYIHYLEFYIDFFASNIKPMDDYELFELAFCSKGQWYHMTISTASSMEC